MTVTETMVTPTHVADLYQRLLDGSAPFILDVRNPDDFGRWRVEGRAGLEMMNIPYYDFIEDEDGTAAQVPATHDVLVVCAKEGSSRYVAELLQARGITASYLDGGILSWGNFYDVRDIVSAPWGRVVQIARPARGDVSFAVISGGQAALIDPLRHTEQYLKLLDEANAELVVVLDTHVHADHISGGPSLSAQTGAPYYVHAYDAIHPIDMLPARIAYNPLNDGQRFTIGDVTLETVWFPGHTLGQVNFKLSAPDGTTALFTGDGIFLRSFGRPDLGGQAEAWTPLLYESLYERLPRHLDDATLILPAHISTLDESDADGRFAAPWRDVRQHNEALAPRTPEEFRSFILSHLPTFPAQYVEIKRVNIGLSAPSEQEAEELELGKNICALAE